MTGHERDDDLSHPPTGVEHCLLLIEDGTSSAMAFHNMAYAVRSPRVGARGFLGELQQVVWSVNPNLPLANVRALDEIRPDSMAKTSFAMVMLAVAASVWISSACATSGFGPRDSPPPSLYHAITPAVAARPDPSGHL